MAYILASPTTATNIPASSIVPLTTLVNTPPNTGLSINAAGGLVVGNSGYYQVTFGVMPYNNAATNPTIFQVQLQINGATTSGSVTQNLSTPELLLEGYCFAANRTVDQFMISLSVILYLNSNDVLTIANFNNSAIILSDTTTAAPNGLEAYITVIKVQ
jgi:hypothetical protein